MLSSLNTAMEPSTVVTKAPDTVRPSTMVSQATRPTMSREEAPSLPQLVAMVANITAATSPQATEVRLEPMATIAKPMVATLVINHTDALMAVITEESDMQSRGVK